MKIQQLRHIVAAADSASYAQAAKLCFTSRQNIAHSVREVEGELGVALFERKGNEVVPTPAGQQVARQARSIIRDVDELRVMFAAPLSEDEIINLAVSMNLFAGISPATSTYFSRRSKTFRFLELDCGECYRAVCTGRVDAALIMCMERTFPECSSIRVAASPSYALVNSASPLAKKKSAEAADIRLNKLALMSDPPFQYVPMFEQLDAFGYDRTAVSVISSTSTMLSVVRGSESVGIVSERFALNPPKGTVAIPFSDEKLNWRFYMLYRRNARGFSSIIKAVQDIRTTFGANVAALAQSRKKQPGGGAQCFFRWPLRHSRAA